MVADKKGETMIDKYSKAATDDGNIILLDGIKPSRTRLIFVSGAYSASTAEGIAANVKRAQDVGRKLLRAGYTPLIPQSMYWTMEDAGKWEDFMDCCKEMISYCDGILMMPGWTLSKGAYIEFLHALSAQVQPYEIVK